MLQAQQISRRFQRGTRSVRAVQDVTLALAAGQLTALTGPSGSGKTTLLHIMAGLLPPTEGTVLLDGQDIYRLADRDLSRLRGQTISMIPQIHSVLSSLTVLENVMLPCALHPNGQDRKTQALALLERLGLDRLAEARPDTLSGGELRRVAVARALLTQPEIILADEPTSNLDKANTAVVMEALRDACVHGAAVLYATHEPEALPYANIVHHMTDGVLCDTGRS